MLKLFRVILFFLCPLTMYAQSGLPVPQAGAVVMNGEVTIPVHLKKDSIWLWCYMPQPFTGENMVYKALLDARGRFTLTVNTQTDISRCVISTDVDITNQVTILLKNGRENKVWLSYNEEGVIDKVNSSENAGFREDELLSSQQKYAQILAYKMDKPADTLYNKPFSVFINYVNYILAKKRSVLEKPPFLSEKMGEIVFRDYSLVNYANSVFDYRANMEMNYSNRNGGRMPDSTEIITPLRNDYMFLKKLDLNNPLNLYCFSYPTFTQDFLKSDVLNIPRIQDTPIPAWIKQVKEILAPLSGLEKGLFYEMLIANAYALQFEMELQPLTGKQLANIRSYSKGGYLEKVLLRRNDVIAEQARLKKELIIQPVPAVSREELMNAIIARYKGKVVVVDFWETWCVPCFEALKASRDLKKQLAGKDVVFIYIASASSPRKVWERDIQGIGGEQYYLDATVRKYISGYFKFTGVPSYLVYDKAGALKEQFTGYPGNEEMLKLIEAARSF